MRDGGPTQCTRILTYMRNVTLSADEDLIKRARALAKAQNKTLSAVFREWLAHYTAGSGDTESFDAIMKRMKHVDAGRHFTRNELNAR
jgi:predicted transcriptional regulator